MPKLQERFLAVLAETGIGRIESRTCWPEWLQRPGEVECGLRWELIRKIYFELTSGLSLPKVMPSKERRSMDGILWRGKSQAQLIEFDESQHFNVFRKFTFAHYPRDLQLGFPAEKWSLQCGRSRNLPGGGFAKPKPPLFPMENGRHLQRAFRDMLADVLPEIHQFGPTLRIADFEVKSWIDGPKAMEQLQSLVMTRVGTLKN